MHCSRHKCRQIPVLCEAWSFNFICIGTVSARSNLLFLLTTQPVIANAAVERSGKYALQTEGAVRLLNTFVTVWSATRRPVFTTQFKTTTPVVERCTSAVRRFRLAWVTRWTTQHKTLQFLNFWKALVIKHMSGKSPVGESSCRGNVQ